MQSRPRLPVLVLSLTLVLSACVLMPPASLQELQQERDWLHGEGAMLARAYQRDADALLTGRSTQAALREAEAAGYECAEGEAADTMVCTRSFATRACQFDWTLTLALAPGGSPVTSTRADFRRDCVGTASDWPEPIVSAIDDQLSDRRLLPNEPF
jgi:hypothetical protein